MRQRKAENKIPLWELQSRGKASGLTWVLKIKLDTKHVLSVRELTHSLPKWKTKRWGSGSEVQSVANSTADFQALGISQQSSSRPSENSSPPVLFPRQLAPLLPLSQCFLPPGLLLNCLRKLPLTGKCPLKNANLCSKTFLSCLMLTYKYPSPAFIWSQLSETAHTDALVELSWPHVFASI